MEIIIPLEQYEEEIVAIAIIIAVVVFILGYLNEKRKYKRILIQ